MNRARAASRRDFLTIAFGASATALGANPLLAAHFVPEKKLSPGEFVWQPERAPDGAVMVIVSLPEQMVHVYRNGVEIGVSSCSTGKPGHRTPAGVFTILEKDRKHVSTIYKGAQMPNMQRLTWGGIALHAGNLPGYPASHGCVRLPVQFSAKLFEITHLGAVVVIADERTQPGNVVHPGILLPAAADAEARALASHVGGKKAHAPWEATVSYPISGVIISRADGRAYITRGGIVRAAYPVAFVNPAKPLGTHVYSLVGPTADGTGLTWLAFGLGKSPTEAHITHWGGDLAMRRIVFRSNQRANEVARSFHPGTTVLITDSSAPLASRATSKKFAVMVGEEQG